MLSWRRAYGSVRAVQAPPKASSVKTLKYFSTILLGLMIFTSIKIKKPLHFKRKS